jgi:FdhD protein
MGERLVATRPVLRLGADGAERRFDSLAGEEPMELRVNGEPLMVTMRTPGDDFDLALGFCLAEGVVEDAAQVATISYCRGQEEPGTGDFNVVDVRLRSPAPVDARLRRRVATTSACGVCGTTSIEAVAKRVPGAHDDDVRVGRDVLASLPDRLRRQQRIFERTGGLHAAALAGPDGALRGLKEDVGRHNAVDKVVGWAARRGELPLRGNLLVVSGRVAFEIVQKAAIGGIPVVAAVSAPTSLAVDLAEAAGMTLVAFIRGGSMNVYAGGHRVLP